MESQPDFTCAICQRAVEMRWNRGGPGETIPPICLYCEGQYSPGAGPPAGDFRDRRIVRQGVAIAEALRCEAAHKSWPEAWRTLRAAT